MLQNGKFGLYFKKNISSIKKMINYCEKNRKLMHNFRVNSFKGINEKYDWDIIQTKYEKIFFDLLSNRF
jgi:glycosyltransferase involved in cell wall biosynthesis